MTDFDPMAYATGGLITGDNRMDGHGLVTVGIIVGRVFPGGFPFTGGGRDRGPEERLERLKREDEEILFIIKEFIKWVT